MAKNYNPAAKYAKIASKTAKNGKIMIQREGDRVYICDGYTAAEVPAAWYDMYFRPLATVFVPLADGERMTKQPADLFPAPVDRGVDIRELLDRYRVDIPAEVLPLLAERGKASPAQLVRVGETLALYDADFIAAARDLAGVTAETLATSDLFPALVWRSDLVRVLMLPLRPADQMREALATVRRCPLRS